MLIMAILISKTKDRRVSINVDNGQVTIIEVR
jgi:hypothetical protein